MKLPTTKAGINAFIKKLRSSKTYEYRVPSDAELTRNPRKYGRHRLSREFPAPRDMSHRVMIEQQSPLFTTNEDGQFSSRGLTDWYVTEFNRLNHLKG